ncbi:MULTISPECIES: AbrB/MazE/SpoVT family DNA-binding domain-containing protein [Priestia]|jgi:AbrB family transcriptional regulator, transcriptional pleiotropic regulator of transition state genes|uniref:AbrB family transcriptional regulator n=3 Tax=Priestia TaxID=2800373 RepID=A0A0H4KE97_9BACI|nr:MULTISPECIES: AbrB/MazE/SpoVT family DNA-binding domain-containing protein [Priestia]AKO91091.1 AbrB family transcriptional regulator [Priestia filamentosa]AVD54415.1 AbrB/MazE/SpoVT family DNA-binding domain-containing protein [Priestia filamentosa]KAB2492466.1 AbrB/MazE/SpoVT family DNA-binding domain-containing protein [Priestia endophytica]KYG35423.1 AbrB family transcriptional regulator [Priestia endophytica]MBG9810377.1 AbrB family transcriptional regulator [Priestia endophytica]
MKTTGMVRKVDELGRIVLPKELRRVLNLEAKEPVEMYLDHEQIILKKYRAHQECMITGEVSSENLSLLNGKIVLSKEGADILMNEIEKKFGTKQI